MSAAKRKGTDAETAVVAYLREHGFPHAERRASRSVLDGGDVSGVVGVMIEVKAEKSLKLSEWMHEVLVQVANSAAVVGLCWHKRRMKGSPGDWYVTVDGATMVWLLRAAGFGQPLEEAYADGRER